MCGIAGIFAYAQSAPPVDQEELLRVRDAMRLRGPDGAGLWISPDSRVGLAHRRLSIIDLSPTGAQPMSTADGRYHITFNGEIYNYKALRDDLAKRGCRFQSLSDTEVLLHLYALDGAEMLHVLRGMYAFAIYDSTERRMFLARDPFGIKPLYYSESSGTFRFASQVKALLKSGRVDTTPAAAGHVGFYLWGHVPDPHTLYKGVRALPAGSSLLVDARGVQPIRTFFSITDEYAKAGEEAAEMGPEDAMERLRAALADSVRHHMVADVPVGIFLSAGIDSTTLTAFAAESGAAELNTVTLGFEEYLHSKNDETPIAARVARHFNTRHHTDWVSHKAFESELEGLLEAMDQPSIDGVNVYFVSRAAARAGLKVAMSGLGGDELFGGYPSFQDLPHMVGLFQKFGSPSVIGRTVRRFSAPLLSSFTSPKYAGLLEYGGSYAGAYLLRRSLFMPWELPGFLDEEVFRDGMAELRTMERLEATVRGVKSSHDRVSALEMSWYMRNQLLRDSDWAGMAHSLEIRVPLVDIALFRALVAATYRQPITKQNFAHAPGTPIPDVVLNREKTGFSIPVQQWLARTSVHHRKWRGLRAWAHRINPPQRRSRRMLVLLTDAFGGRGGIAKFNRDFLNALCSHAECGEVVAVPRLMPNSPEPMPAKLTYLAGGVGGKGKYLLQLAKLVSGDTRFDLVICGHVNLVPLAWLVSVLSRVPLILVIHGIDAWKPTRSLLTNFLVTRVDAFIAVSSLTRQRFLHWARLKPERGMLLPNSVDLSAYRVTLKREDLLRKHGIAGKRLIMTVGRLVSSERYKGFDEVIEALPELIKIHSNLVYLIAGEGNDRLRLETKVQELGLNENVVFVGYVAEEEKGDYYNLADAFVMPSRGEGFGIVFLEAMACGLPVVGSTLDGSREALRDGALGILVDPRDALSVRRGILEALERPRAIPTGLDYFSFESFERRTHQILSQW